MRATSLGYALVHGGQGFQSTITLVIGVSSDLATITGIEVLDQNETPGLGTVIKEESFLSQFLRMSVAEKIGWVKGPPADGANQVQVVTGATMSRPAPWSRLSMKASPSCGGWREQPMNETRPLLSEYTKGLWQTNPVIKQSLGLCPALAVTVTALNGLAMGLATTFVLVFSSLIVSLIRGLIPRQVRIASFHRHYRHLRHHCGPGDESPLPGA
jgi:hypothetical protein